MLFERKSSSRSCLFDSQKICPDANSCAAHRAWHEVGDAMTRFLEMTTLADIAAQKILMDRG
jgi:DNA-binding IscR family transcriptional regulator